MATCDKENQSAIADNKDKERQSGAEQFSSL